MKVSRGNPVGSWAATTQPLKRSGLAFAGALTVGLAAGSISTLGFAYLTPLLENTIGLGDTCGVHNLHGIPGIIGGLVRCAAHLWLRASDTCVVKATSAPDRQWMGRRLPEL